MVDDITSRLRSAATGPRDRGSGCPDEHEIAAYVDGTLPASDAPRLEAHLADCDSCIALVGLLSRKREGASDSEAVPEVTLARARALVPSKRGGWSRFAPHLAAAAAIVITVSALTGLLELQGIRTGGGTGERVTRSSPPGALDLNVLYPSAGSTLAPGQLRFRWSAVPGSRYYEVRI